MTVNFSKDKFNLREKLKELERPSVDKLITKDENGAYIDIIRGNTKLESINSVKSDTAVDVFVYDTSKDSDGGAWRKRTKHTSWYNEAASSTRGSRKEFPAVAVIVREAGFLKIYDGDDPDLPMWMVFESNNNGVTSYLLGYHTTGGTSVTALNGIITSGHGTNGATTINFINEKTVRYRATAASGTYDILETIADRNTLAVISFAPYANTIGLVNSAVNDVAMTVLPNAPVDSSTGLPIPTIAVATESGVSVVRNDGNVVDYTAFNPAQRVEIDSSYVYAGTRSGSNDYIFKSSLISSDGSYATNITAGSGGWYANSVSNATESPTLKNMTVTDFAVTKDHTLIRSGNDGIEIFDGNVTTIDANEAELPIAYITSSYNTGYMHGDVKGAFLSSIDATNMTGGNLVTNGDAWSGALSSTSSTPPTGWTGALGAKFRTNSGGDGTYINLINAGSAQGGPNSYMFQAITTVAGRRYKISLTQIHHATITVFFGAATTAGGTNLLYNSFVSSSSNTPRELSGEFTATGTTTYIRLGIISGTNDYWVGWDNVVVTEVDEDRSVNANGLHSFGTITKSPVATGADLVVYSGFSASNYLQQPYNSDLDFGTGDFSFMAWIYPTNDNVGGIISRGSNGVYGPYGLAYSATIITLVSSSDWNESNDGGSWGTIIQTASGVTPKNVWSHVVAVKSGTTAYVYTNGVLRGTDTSAVNPKVPTSNFIPTMIGAERTPLTGAIGRPFPGSLALVRASASAPSAEQVKKMYEDEKFLFQENAKATLYGSSDAVTALAFDDATNTLHAGTSSGRSDFQGLRRINNTTTAVTTAISAHDEFIIEQ